jgi:hypothetical protein
LSLLLLKEFIPPGVDAVFSVDEFTSLALNAREVCPKKYAAVA